MIFSKQSYSRLEYILLKVVEPRYEQADAEPLTGADEARLATITNRLEYLTDRLETFSEADLASAGAKNTCRT